MEVWIGRDGERHGPYKESDIRQWLRSGQVSRDDLGWYEGLADWQPFSVLFPDEQPTAATPPDMAPYTAPPIPQATTTTALEDYAGFWQRFAAWLIDGLILAVPAAILFVATGAADAYMAMLGKISSGSGMGSQEMNEALQAYVRASRPATIGSAVIGFVYYTLMEASRMQATLGKLALRLRVTDDKGQRVTIGRSATRNVVRLLTLLTGLIPFICYLAVAWTQRRQGLHDLVAHTLILNGRASEQKASPVSSSDNIYKREGGSFDA
ncbi:RDD family protein [Dyella sp.]|uniref:RDD family protein n=1 Tax=Dyella sp. TaxID=1869338 RepID=UPI002ED1DB8F